jgi:hypothetical protein
MWRLEACGHAHKDLIPIFKEDFEMISESQDSASTCSSSDTVSPLNTLFFHGEYHLRGISWWDVCKAYSNILEGHCGFKHFVIAYLRLQNLQGALMWMKLLEPDGFHAPDFISRLLQEGLSENISVTVRLHQKIELAWTSEFITLSITHPSQNHLIQFSLMYMLLLPWFSSTIHSSLGQMSHYKWQLSPKWESKNGKATRAHSSHSHSGPTPHQACGSDWPSECPSCSAAAKLEVTDEGKPKDKQLPSFQCTSYYS